MQDYRKLRVWRHAHVLTLAIYKATGSFPTYERYGLASQMRRSAASIPTNLAEGCGRGSDADFARFVQMALGSASELDYQLLLAGDLGYFEHEDVAEVQEMVHRVMRRLTGLRKRLQKASS